MLINGKVFCVELISTRGVGSCFKACVDCGSQHVMYENWEPCKCSLCERLPAMGLESSALGKLLDLGKRDFVEYFPLKYCIFQVLFQDFFYVSDGF